MRGLSTLAGIILLILGGAAKSQAVMIPEPVDHVTVEVTLGNDWSIRRFKVPISEAKQRKVIDDQVAGGEWALTGACLDDICSYGIWITADALDREQANVWATFRFQFKNGKKCEVSREFRVVRGKSAERKMKCRNAKAHLRLSY